VSINLNSGVLSYSDGKPDSHGRGICWWHCSCIQRRHHTWQVQISKWWCHSLYMRQSPYRRPANVNSYRELYIGCVILKSIQANSYQSSCFHVVKAVLAFFFSRHTKQRIVHQDKHPVTGTCTRAFSQSLCIISKCMIGTVTLWWCELAGLAFKQTSDGVILFVVTAEAVLSYSLSAKDRRVRHMESNHFLHH